MAKVSIAPPTRSVDATIPWQDQAQLALAIADDGVLRALLTNCQPPLARPYEVGAIQAEVGIPAQKTEGQHIDGLLRFERVQCVVGGSVPHIPTEPPLDSYTHYQALTSCQSELYMLMQNAPVSEVIALLAHAGFAPDDISQILHLPYQAWHKSWWYMADLNGGLTVPFQRFIRTRRYGDGTFTLQYKDYYAQEPPPNFHGTAAQVPILIRQENESFGATLERINTARNTFETEQAILIVEQIHELEAEGFLRQQVSLFTHQTLSLPLEANCRSCHKTACPMQGVDSSPVVVCRAYEA